MSKNVKKTESVIEVSFQSTAVFTLLHFEIGNWHFRCKSITRVNVIQKTLY